MSVLPRVVLSEVTTAVQTDDLSDKQKVGLTVSLTVDERVESLETMKAATTAAM